MPPKTPPNKGPVQKTSSRIAKVMLRDKIPLTETLSPKFGKFVMIGTNIAHFPKKRASFENLGLKFYRCTRT